jgi:hypothetical protein
MKKLIIIGALFVSQINFGQHYTFQVFTNYEEFFVGEGQIAEPFQSFLAEHGVFYPDIAGPNIIFDDDPGDYIFPMFVVPEQANVLEDLLTNSDIIHKFARHNGETQFVLDRMYLKYFVGMIPEFLGIENGIVVTDNLPLNNLFEIHQVDNYAQSFPSSTNPNLYTVYQIRCNGCDIFQLAQEIIENEIIENTAFDEYVVLLNIEESETTNGFTISPNPNNGNFNLRFKDQSFSEAELIIFDAMGRKIFKKKLQYQQNSINLQGLQSGLYFAQIHSGESKTVKKFIIK